MGDGNAGVTSALFLFLLIFLFLFILLETGTCLICLGEEKDLGEGRVEGEEIGREALGMER